MAEPDSAMVEPVEVEDPVPADGQNSDSSDRPVIELFVKAAVDKMKNGGCPICHRYFLVFYILRERGLIDLVVTTFLPENPPKEVLDFSNGKHYPLVKVHKGLDANGVDMSGVECDTVDEIEQLLDRFDCDDMYGRRESKKEAQAEQVFDDLYKKFNLLVKGIADEKAVTRILVRIDEYLQESETDFLVGERMARADCYFLPIVQHVRVAGKAYMNYEIPTELSYLWRYLATSYETDAFKESCPADREIITHYVDKVKTASRVPPRKSQLMGEERTFSIPQPAPATGNGEVELADE
jgi:chloride intracellular channel protein 2